MDTYQIAMYIRLSKEDKKVKGTVTERTFGTKCESNSIAMQKILLAKYAADNFTDYHLHVFCEK